MTLTAYLVQRGKKAKALTKIEADVFGIPYPLLAGWPRRHGSMEITEEMVERVATQVALASQSADKAVRRSVKRVTAAPASSTMANSPKSACPTAGAAERLSPIPGFVLRQARRYRSRRSAPWA
ncbi:MULTISPECIES: hypothetical protein [unclassified Massilia]|uniref:hypothetical protein n=1 Tax=unclassified Massilia TaxID=2609279 RepID=UPI00177F9CFA|nr:MULTISPECIES: hypothetical protein [unclassified Massilia]MBD8531522.1 hypothetical protein [Massilia sp. CFBP 13647]MBD8673682.1 hypothetical protein [Massilia sp. CFBP 13721]